LLLGIVLGIFVFSILLIGLGLCLPIEEWVGDFCVSYWGCVWEFWGFAFCNWGLPLPN
jgi:hypothetical protein